MGDIIYGAIAVTLIVIYCSMFLGSCSPMHCRFLTAITGVLCVLLACASGYGICYIYDWKGTELVSVLPVLILGIGVDDMFVICNAIDQVPINLPPSERVKRGMQHAGPSITITSLTDCMAFFIGSTSSMLAIKAFCVFCGVTVIMLYLSVITIFLSVVVWDTHRVAKRGKECCGLCCCGEDSLLFCQGRFLTPNQRKYSNLEPSDRQKPSQPKTGPTNESRATTTANSSSALSKGKPSRKSSYRSSSSHTAADSAHEPARKDEEETTVASYTEIFLLNKWAPELFSRVGKVSVIFVFTVWTVFAAYGCSQVKIDFDFDMFLTDKDMLIYKYRAVKRDYYGGDGETLYFYTNNTDLDYFSEQSQLTMYDFDEALSRCRGCSQPWVIPGTLRSWNHEFRWWLDQGACLFAPGGTDPFTKVLNAAQFELCLEIWLKQDTIGRTYKEDMKISSEDGRLLGFKQRVDVQMLRGLSSEGIPFMLDIQTLEQTYGLNETYSFHYRYGEIEQYRIFLRE